MDIEGQAYTKIQQFLIFSFSCAMAIVGSIKFAAPDLTQLIITLAFAIFALVAFNLKHELQRLAKKTATFRNPIKQHLNTLNAIVYPVFFSMVCYRVYLIVLSLNAFGA